MTSLSYRIEPRLNGREILAYNYTLVFGQIDFDVHITKIILDLFDELDAIAIDRAFHHVEPCKHREFHALDLSVFG